MSQLLIFMVLFTLSLPAACMPPKRDIKENMENPYALGRIAAEEAKQFDLGFGKRQAHAGLFMAAWHQACVLAKQEAQSSPLLESTGEGYYDLTDAKFEFIKGYIAEINFNDTSNAATKKLLQHFVEREWWKSGRGCVDILRDTPSWALQ